MFFLIAFAWLVAASFGFLLAILSPVWIQSSATLANRTFDARIGIFQICEYLSGNATYQTTRCIPMTHFNAFNYASSLLSNLLLSAASIAIACAGLSVIALWCAGIFFHLRRKSKHTQCFLIIFSLFILLIFLTSVAVWAIVIGGSATFVPNFSAGIFSWPTWLAVGASGAYLMSFFSMCFSFCAVCWGKRNQRDKNIYRQDNHHF